MVHRTGEKYTLVLNEKIPIVNEYRKNYRYLIPHIILQSGKLYNFASFSNYDFWIRHLVSAPVHNASVADSIYRCLRYIRISFIKIQTMQRIFFFTDKEVDESIYFYIGILLVLGSVAQGLIIKCNAQLTSF